MADGLSITIHLSSYRNILVKAVAAHIADLRQALRALEDGSFVERAKVASPGSLITLQFSDNHDVGDDAVHRHTRRCFRSMIADFITFLDQLLAARNVRERPLIVPSEGFPDPDAAVALIESALKAEYHAVASDTRLRSPEKVRRLVEAKALSKESAKIIGSYIDLRSLMEHHRGIPPEPAIVFFRRPRIFVGETEVVGLPAVVREGESVRVKLVTESRLLPPGSKIALTEAEVDAVASALGLVASEILDGLAPKV